MLGSEIYRLVGFCALSDHGKHYEESEQPKENLCEKKFKKAEVVQSIRENRLLVLAKRDDLLLASSSFVSHFFGTHSQIRFAYLTTTSEGKKSLNVLQKKVWNECRTFPNEKEKRKEKKKKIINDFFRKSEGVEPSISDSFVKLNHIGWVLS